MSAMNGIENGDVVMKIQRRRSARIRTTAAVLINEEDTQSKKERQCEEENGGQRGVKRKRSRGKAKALKTGEDEQLVEHELDLSDSKNGEKASKSTNTKTKAKAKTRKGKGAVTGASGTENDGLTVEHDDQAYNPESPSKKKKGTRKPRTPKPEPVYVIPDVEKRETKFRGRLGYACLNTVLRNKKPATDSIFCSRTCRIDSIKKNGMDWVKDLGRKNVQDLIKMIQWNEDNNIRFLRISSEMFPFASHAIYGYSLSYCAPELAQAGVLARKYGHRLTSHPGQFTQLGSPKPGVIEAAVRDLEYHCEMMELMGVGKDGVLVIHGGGVYGEKEATIERIKSTIREVLPRNVRDRLVLENDELCYNAEDLLPICEELDVPLVFDYHHDALNPSSIPPSEIIKRANAIFHRRGIRPKQHLSEPRPGAVTLMERRAHADRCERLPEELDVEGVAIDVDLMIEAKDKEQAVLQLYRVYGLEEVKYESLRPPNENQTKETKETKGRKSNKKGTKGKKSMDEEEGMDLDQDVDDVRAVEDEDHDHEAIVSEESKAVVN